MDIFEVIVTQEGEAWLADVPAIPGTHTHALSFLKLRQAVREAIAVGLDLPEGYEQSISLIWRQAS
jgi:predicted RNase H-like HicB family nuclease